MAQVDLVADGFRFTEGPVWFPGRHEPLAIPPGSLLFSDLEADTILVLHDRTVATFREPSFGANGNAIDADGRLLTCEHAARAVSRTDRDGRSVLVDRFEGARLNSPNDIVVARDGTVYFTDPPYGVRPDDRELPFQGVFRFDDPVLTLVADDLVKPNGVALDDESTLFVADTETGHIWAFDVDRVPAPRRLVATLARPDGLVILPDGRLVVACLDGLTVVNGDEHCAVPMPQRPANLTVAGERLVVCARTAIYHVIDV